MKVLSNLHVRDILKGGTQALILKVIATAAGFAVSVVLGRFYGPEGIGIYALMVATIMIGATFATAGIDNAVIKYVSADLAIKDTESATKTLRTGLLITFILSSFIAIIVLVNRDLIANSLLGNSLIAPLLGIAAASIIFISMTRICSAGLKTIGNIPAAHFADGVAMPCGILAVFLLSSGSDIDRAALSYISGALLAVLIGGASLFVCVRSKKFTRTKADLNTAKNLLKMGWPTLGIVLGVLATELASITSLSHFATIEDVGMFRIAWQVAFLLSFLTMATDSVMSPKISALYTKGEFNALAKVLRFNLSLLSIFSILGAIILVLSSPFIFKFIGENFLNAVPILSILVFGQVINGTLGTAGKVLIMTGHEKKSLINSLAGVVVISASSWVLVPKYGAQGAAIAVVLTMLVRCVSAVFLVRLLLGINMFTGKCIISDQGMSDG